VLCLAGAGAGYLYWVVAGPPIPIEGLAIVFPAMWAGLWLLERGDLHSEVTRFVGIALLVFVVAVILTQSPGGGGPEWGGRYFVLALPMAAPLVAAVLGRVVGRGLGGLRYRATAASAVAVVTVLLAVAAVQSLHYANANAAALLKAVDKAGAEARAPFPGDADRRPVAVTTIPLIPQLLWEGYDRLRWLGPTETTLREYAARLARGNAQRIVLLTDDPKRDLDAVRPWFHEVDRPRIGLGRPPPHPVVVLQRS